ncbi:hypothetical protein D9M68_747740 [compost metagenome]
MALGLGGGVLRPPQVHAGRRRGQLDLRQLQPAPVAHAHHALAQFAGRLGGIQHVALVFQHLLRGHGLKPGLARLGRHFQQFVHVVDAALQAGVHLGPPTAGDQLPVLGAEAGQGTDQFAVLAPGLAHGVLGRGQGQAGDRGGIRRFGGRVGLLPLEHVGVAALERSDGIVGLPPVKLRGRGRGLGRQGQRPGERRRSQQPAGRSDKKRGIHCDRSFLIWIKRGGFCWGLSVIILSGG